MAERARTAALRSRHPDLGRTNVIESTNDSFNYDVAILGAGAAGLVAALRAAQCGARTLLLEKNRRAGVKILMSGGTRCNITNARGLRRLDVISGSIDPAYDAALSIGIRAIQRAFWENGAFLGPALRRFDVDSTLQMFERAGVATKIEANGKVFPVSDRAVDVLEALLRLVAESGAELRCESPALAVEHVGHESCTETGFIIRLPDSSVTARRVIVAVGGASYPGCGTIGDGYAIARYFGHTVIEPRPALVPLRVVTRWVADLKGLSVRDVVASVRDDNGAVSAERRESVLFAHFGLTGPAILDISRAVGRQSDVHPLVVRLDLLPSISVDELDRQLRESCRQGRRVVASLLPAELPRRLLDCLALVAGMPADRMGPDLSRDERQRLITTIKSLTLPSSGTLGMEKAEVTSGGVRLEEIDPKTLESRLVPGLHFAGEVLDLDGLIGGYNFQAAWSTGWLAGEAAVQ
jgi:predicted Rossmann fold flavoprotein